MLPSPDPTRKMKGVQGDGVVGGLQLNGVGYRIGCDGGHICVEVESWKLFIEVGKMEMVLNLLFFESVL